MSDKLIEALTGELTKMEARIAKSQEETYDGIQKQLDSLQERGSDINDETVKDLEKRLAEREGETKELKKAMDGLSEELRLLRTEKAGLAVVEKKDKLSVFKGMFFDDVDAVRVAVRAQMGMAGSETRALDTGLFGGGFGRVPVEVADSFIDMIVEQAATLGRCTTMRMSAPQRRIDELRVGQRTIRAGVENTDPALANSISMVGRNLQTVEVILAEDITWDLLEENIEKANLEGHIASILVRSFRTQLNDLALNGDATTGNFLAINRGWFHLMQADGDVTDVDLTGITVPKEVLRDVMNGMPVRFRTAADLAFTVPVPFAQHYADQFADRETSAGDQVYLEGFPNLRYFGRMVYPDVHMAETQVGVETHQKILFTPMSNLIHGIQRDMTIEGEWQPRPRRVEYTMTAKVDAEYSTGEPISLGDNLDASLIT